MVDEAGEGKIAVMPLFVAITPNMELIFPDERDSSGGAGGPLGSAVKLGQAIGEMQQHVDGLQKNIEVLKTVKASLGG